MDFQIEFDESSFDNYSPQVDRYFSQVLEEMFAAHNNVHWMQKKWNINFKRKFLKNSYKNVDC